MSVIVKNLRDETVDFYLKGAPEVVKLLCDPSTGSALRRFSTSVVDPLTFLVPGDYEERLSQFARQGHRVVACAYKPLPGMNWMRAQRVQRRDIEGGLRFAGFVVFENKIKPETAPVMKLLTEARFRNMMVTGDNVLTAVNVGKNCGIIAKDARVYIPASESTSHSCYGIFAFLRRCSS